MKEGEGGREDACGLYPTDYEREGGCVKEVLFLFLFSFLSSSSSSSFLSDFPWLLQPTNFTRLKLEDDSGSKIVTGSCSNCSLAFSGPQLFFFFFFISPVFPSFSVFDPHASRILGTSAATIQLLQSGTDATGLEKIAAAVRGKKFTFGLNK